MWHSTRRVPLCSRTARGPRGQGEGAGHGDAARLAKKGYAGLLLRLLLEELAVRFTTWDPLKDIAAMVTYMAQERRGLDVFATLPKIDSERVGFVNWSNGAYLGTLLAAIEPRIKAFALLGVGTATFMWSGGA